MLLFSFSCKMSFLRRASSGCISYSRCIHQFHTKYAFCTTSLWTLSRAFWVLDNGQLHSTSSRSFCNMAVIQVRNHWFSLGNYTIMYLILIDNVDVLYSNVIAALVCNNILKSVSISLMYIVHVLGETSRTR